MDSSPLQAGQQFANGRFVLTRPLGRGGMGEVWLARDERLNEDVALKFLPPEIRGDARALDDLRRETARSHKLTHPNIVRIHDLHEEDGGMAFIVMEYVDGPTLAAVSLQQPRGVLNWGQLRPWVEQLCMALDYAHGEKVIHRDLKPANLMVDGRGRLKLADFGIAALASDSMSRVTGKQATSGTLLYMSPQQLAGKRPQASDDIYALGATLYELLTSQPPFCRGDLTHQILNEMPEPPGERLAGLEIHNYIPPDVGALVMACLAKEGEKRPASARAMAEWIGLQVVKKPTGKGLTEATFGKEEEGPAQEALAPPTEQEFSIQPTTATEESGNGATQMPKRATSVVRQILSGMVLGALCTIAGILAVKLWSHRLEIKNEMGQTPEIPQQRSATVKTATLSGVAPNQPVQTSGISLRPGMVLIPAGSFTMGDTLDGDSDAIPMNIYESAFYMDTNLVSYSLWQKVYTYATNNGYSFDNAGSGRAENHPVQTVDWYDCVKWCNARSARAGLTPVYYTDVNMTQLYTNGDVDKVYPNWAAIGYRLPTEAEWEKAARGGLSGQRFPWGNTISESQANYSADTSDSYDLGPYNGYNNGFDTGGQPHTSPVGYFGANGYGLKDMAGNVCEWCWDWYGIPYGQPMPNNPTGPASGGTRILRGGSWDDYAKEARCADRGNNGPDGADDDIGFRCVSGGEASP